MIHGLYLDNRVWEMDIKPSKFWNPIDHEIVIDLPHTKTSRIAKQNIKIDPKYRFAITTSVWEKPIRATLQHLRKQGIKIFLLPREPFKFGAHKTAMFSHPKYLMGKEYFFKPDAVFAPGQDYANYWSNITRTYITGYPRFELYLDKQQLSKQEVAKKYGLDESRRWIFFPDYPPIFTQDINNKIVEVNLEKVRDDSIISLEKFAKETKAYQIIVKLHPQTWKSYTKYKLYISDMIKNRLDNPTSDIKIITDSWDTSTQVAQELLSSSDIVTGFASTMLLEATIINKPTVYMLFGNTSKLSGLPAYDKYIPTAHNEKELFDILYKDITVNKGLVQHYLCDVDGNSCKRICNAILNELK